MKLFLSRLALLGTIAAARAAVQVDTVGVTGADYQNYGPAWQRVFYLPGTGIYVCWLKVGMSANFFSSATQTWRGEAEVFGSERNAGGNLDVLPGSGSPYRGSTFISSFLSRNPKWPVVAIESVPGSGSYEMRARDTSLMGCQKAPVAFSASGTLHLLCLDSTNQDTLLYSRSTDYGTNWSPLASVCSGSVPGDPTHNVAASDESGRVAAIWSTAGDQALWLNISNDDGTNWSGPQNLFPLPSPIPNARPGKFGGFGFFDRDNRLNVVTQVWNGTDQYPAEIWHWQESRSPSWTMVYRYAPDRVLAQAEPGEPFVLRPSIAQRSADGRLFVAWMNYDSTNYEPQTQIARADIYMAQSDNNGLGWSRPLRATGPDNGSRLAPCLAPTVTDTAIIACVIDQLAGVFELGHGPQTANHPAVLRVPVQDIPGVGEGSENGEVRVQKRGHTLVRDVLFLPVSLFAPHSSLLDPSGRNVMPLRPGANDVHRLAPGIYFLHSGLAAHKIVVTR